MLTKLLRVEEETMAEKNYKWLGLINANDRRMIRKVGHGVKGSLTSRPLKKAWIEKGKKVHFHLAWRMMVLLW